MAVTDNVLRYIAAGFQRLDFHRLDSDGLPAGITGEVTANDPLGVGAGRIKLAKTLNITTQAGEVVPITGDDIYAGGFMFDNVQPRSFECVAAEDDFVDRDAFQNITYQNKGNFSFVGRDIKPFTVNDTMILGISRAQAQSTGALGLPMYAGVLATRCQFSIRGRDAFSERAAAGFNLTANLNAMDAYPWGETFKVDEEGYLASFVQDFTSRMPPTVHRWKGLTAVTNIFVAETPASASLSDMLLYSIDSNNIPTLITTGVTIDPATKKLTFSSPHTSVNLEAWYMYVPS
jgi:hypothetical protein